MKRSFRILMAGMLSGLLFASGCGEITSVLKTVGIGNQEESTQTPAPEPVQKETQTEPEVIALTVGTTQISLTEAAVYDFLLKEPLVQVAGDTITDGVHPDGGRFEDRLETELKNQIVQITILSDLAEAEGITLSDEENENVQARAALLLSEYPELSEKGITQETACAAYTRSMLAGLYYDKMTEGYKENLTEAEKASCQVRVISQIFIAEGDISHLGKYKNEDELAKALLKRAQKDEDFQVLAQTYSSPGAQMTVTLNDEGYAYDIDAFVDEDFTAAAVKLKAGELSGVVKTSMGRHILKCISVGDETLSAQAQQALMEKKKQAYFSDIYESLASGISVSEGDGWQALIKGD